MFTHSDLAPCRAVCCSPVCAELFQILSLCVVSLSPSFPFVAGLSCVWHLRSGQAQHRKVYFVGILSVSHVPSSLFSLLLSAGSVCVLAVSGSVASSAGRGDLWPRHSDLPTCQLHTWTPSPLHIHTHTHIHTHMLPLFTHRGA